MLVLVAILGWAHFRAHRELRNLPGRLGADIQREANGFTYSQTVGGRVLFTLRAKRATQHRTGEAQLDDAGLVLYGDHNGRADRIYGKNFLYNQRAGVVKAVGVVRLDLAAPAPTNGAERLQFASGGALPAKAREAAAAGMVQATTSGLVYTQATGIAATAEEVRFSFRGLNGEAQGASYRVQDGSVTLERAVRFAGRQDGRTFQVTASHAVLHRAEGQVLLADADLHLTRDGAAGEEEVRSAQLLLRMGAEGGVARAEGSGGVELRSAGDVVRAPEAVLLLQRGSVPKSLEMRGGVRLERVSAAAGERVTGTAQRSEAHFNDDGRLLSEQMLGGVRLAMARGGATREMAGDKVELLLAGGQALREARAEGGAVVRVMDRGGAASSLGGDRVVAAFAQSGRALELDRVTATGAALLRREEQGLVETSRAARIEATFLPSARDGGGAAALGRVVQEGGVVMDRELRRGEGGEVVRTHAVAREATYDAGAKRSVLTGGVEVVEPERVLKADRVAIAGETGDAEAEGSVQATLLQGPGKKQALATAEGSATAPLHLVGARAVLRRASGVVTVYGEGSREAGCAAVGGCLAGAGAGAAAPAGERYDGCIWNGGGTEPAVEAVLPMGGGSGAAFGGRGAAWCGCGAGECTL